MIKIWGALFLTFLIYTFLVYKFCDQKNPSKNVPGTEALAGFNTWQHKNCQTCHQIYGLGGYLGPDLTNIASDSTKNEALLYAFIKSGNGRMPNFNLNDTEIHNLIAFLKWIDKSGKSKVPKEKVTWSGNYNLEQ